MLFKYIRKNIFEKIRSLIQAVFDAYSIKGW